MANWEQLPQDILKLIAHRLAIDDFLALRGVCTLWRSADVIEMYSAKSKAPWLMTSTCTQAKFFSPSGEKIYRVQFSGFRPVFSSSQGWILVSKCVSDYYIFNPISRVRIKLPSLEKIPCCPSGIDRIALSSSPSLSRNYTVMVSISGHLGPLGFALNRSGEDAWTVVSPSTHHPQSNVRGLVHYDGLFVALVARNQIMTLDEREHRMRSRLVLGHKFKGWPYLVECLGSLLVVWKIPRGGVRTEYSFRVFEIDLKKGTEEEVKSLGNASLFFNGASLFSVEFKAETCFPGIKPNCIYFPQVVSTMMFVYSMEHGKFERYPNALGNYDSPLNWFQLGF